MGQLDEALTSLERAHKYQPKHWYILIPLSVVYANLGRTEEARNTLGPLLPAICAFLHIRKGSSGRSGIPASECRKHFENMGQKGLDAFQISPFQIPDTPGCQNSMRDSFPNPFRGFRYPILYYNTIPIYFIIPP